jgi:hypothetical protein
MRAGSSSEGSSDPADYEELAAAIVLLATRGLNWLANRTVLRGKEQPLDLTATRVEAMRLGRPIARVIVRYYDLGDGVTLSEKKELIRTGLAGGIYVERVADGRPGGQAEMGEVMEAAFEERPKAQHGLGME